MRGVCIALVAWAGVIAPAGEIPAHAAHFPIDAPPEIAPQDLQRYRDAGEDIVLIDLRPPEAFRAGHLPRARSLPISEFRRRAGEVPPAGRVVLYATAPEEAAAAYQFLRDAGYRNVMVLAGGLPEWARLGLPVETAR